MHFFTPLVVLGALATSSTALPHNKAREASEFQFADYCYPNPCAGIVSQNDSYVCGDSRLGPVKAPKKFPLNNELRTYARFGSLCPVDFLEKWAGSINSSASYEYPPSNGFVVDTKDAPILGNATLSVGQKVDRFGSEYGSFLAPLGSPYIQRSLPPSNLITYDGDYPFNYHVYEVTKSFDVGLGPIAPWFEQPGMGTQFLAYDNVKTLLQGGYLRRLEPEQYDEAVEYSNSYTTGPSN
ncbi:hypothetical protein N7462_008642 [Penicillium macrosclerotiorum]|uniref:uncharacterized protein n=1 Tax=Penicillium macrosclerotiorum TaxID=303699 RepID=UPI0025467320|nr:uncharacterized protein N7462_008642 [Penicillium macrosclerotiorum]KAJ5675745.1 hypothetical protein N7462_008642 [Penicillium macrosclerotiorum]